MSAEIISFVLKTVPVGKARPRFTRQGFAYTPKRTASFERFVKATARKAMAMRKPYGRTVAISLTLDFFFQIPKSWSRKKQERMLGKPKLSKSDLDNLEKSVLDGFNKVIYEDDANVYELIARKKWDTENHIDITIRAEEQSE